MANIKVNEVLDNSVKVNIIHSPKMANAVDEMMELDERTFCRVLRVAKSYRKSNKLASKLVGLDGVTVQFKDNDLEIVKELVGLGNEEFKKAIRCAKKFRRAGKLMELAQDNYEELETADRAFLSQKAAIYA